MMTIHCTAVSPPTTRRRRASITREFVQSSFNWRCLELGDLVLVVIPEEMELLQQVDASLNGRVGYITKIEDDEVEVTLRPVKKKKRCTSPDSSERDPMYMGEQEEVEEAAVCETVFVSRFCLCLERHILELRVTEQQLQLYGY